MGGGGTIPRIGDVVFTTVKDNSPAKRYKNTVWELVAQNRVPMGAGDGHEGGETVEAGLPNITGSVKQSYGAFIWQIGSNKGAVSNITNTGHTDGKGVAISYTYDNSAPAGGAGFEFNASASNPIYGASDTVQPSGYYFYFWRRVS